MSLFRSAVGRMKPCLLTGMSKTLATGTTTRVLSRNLVLASSSGRNPRGLCNTSNNSKLCSCGCGINGMHTRGDRELVEFLQEEIVAEKKALVSTAVPSHLDDFAVSATKAEIKLTKSFHDEDITITLNVNHTVDNEAPTELSGDQDQPDTGELKCRPSFEIDMKVGGQILSFTCSFTGPVEGGEQEDVFGVNEITMYEGEWGEEVYCVSGDILDGMMYDLLMNMLEERGITNEFAEQLSSLCSNYEHSQYVSLLQKMQDFIKRK